MAGLAGDLSNSAGTLEERKSCFLGRVHAITLFVGVCKLQSSIVRLAGCR